MSIPETSLSQAATNAIGAIDMELLFSGKPVEVKVKLGYKQHKTYQFQLKKNHLKLKEKGLLPNFFSDSSDSNCDEKTDSLASSMLTELYHSKKVGSDHFITLITRPGYVNKRTLEVLPNIGKNRLHLIVDNCIASVTVPKKHQLLIQTLEECDHQKIAKYLATKEDAVLSVLLSSNAWSCSDHCLGILFWLPDDRKESYLRSLKTEDLLIILRLSLQPHQQTHRSLHYQNWAIDCCEQIGTQQLRKCLLQLNQQALSNWLVSKDPYQMASLIINLPISLTIKCINSLDACSVQDLVIIEIDSVGSPTEKLASVEPYRAVLNCLVKSITVNELQPKWKRIIQSLSLKQIDALFISAPIEYQLTAVSLVIQKQMDPLIFQEWFTTLPLKIRTQLIAKMPIEQKLTLIGKIPKRQRLEFIKIFPVSKQVEVVEYLSNKDMLNILNAFHPNQLLALFYIEEESTNLGRAIIKKAITIGSFKDYFKNLTAHYVNAEIRSLMLRLSPQVNLIALDIFSETRRSLIIPDKELENPSTLAAWSKVLPPSYIVDKIISKQIQLKPIDIFTNFKVSPELVHTLDERLSENDFQLLVKSHPQTLCQWSCGLSFERRMALNHIHSFLKWKKISKTIPMKNLSYWVDFNCKLQVEHWLNCCEPSQIFTAYESLPQDQIHLLMNLIPIKYLVTLLTLISSNTSHVKASEFIVHAAFHPQMPLLMVEWYENDCDECELTVLEILDFDNTRKKQFLEALSNRRFYNICYYLSQIATPIRDGTQVSAHRLRYATAAQVIQQAFRRHQKLLLTKHSHNQTLTTSNEETHATYHHSVDRLHPPLRTPSKAKLSPNIKQKGNLKRVVKTDGQYMLFKVETETRAGYVPALMPAMGEETPPVSYRTY